MNSNYTTISNELFEIGLSMKAIGLYMVVRIMIEDEEKVTLKNISDKINEGMTSTRNALNELIEKGVISRNPLRGDNGGFNGYEYKIIK